MNGSSQVPTYSRLDCRPPRVEVGGLPVPLAEHGIQSCPHYEQTPRFAYCRGYAVDEQS